MTLISMHYSSKCPRMMQKQYPSRHGQCTLSVKTARCIVSSRNHLSKMHAVPEDRDAYQWMDEKLKHVIESQQFNKHALAEIFKVSREMEDIRPNSDESRQLQGRIMSTLFYEPSTRTRLSFESAMARLGGTVLSTESAGEYSSAAKGETLEDTIRTVEAYADTIVLRHFQAGSARRAANAASVPIINAGDGPGQHPTQALLDVYTIDREIGRLDNFKIGMVGDLANGRTVRSLAYVLSMYQGVKMYFVAPDVVRMKDDIKAYLSSQGVEWEEVEDLKAVASDVNVLYQTRIQKERFQDRPEDYDKAKGKYIVDSEVMNLLPKDAVVMHPLPRVDEIDPRVDSDPRAAYFRQAKNGLFISATWFFMALLLLVQADVARSLRLEHSVDGGKSFKLIGDIDIDPVEKHIDLEGLYGSKLVAIQDELMNAARKDPSNMYHFRVSTDEDSRSAVMSSIPASCWIQAGDKAHIRLHSGDHGDSVQGVSLHAPCSREQVGDGPVGSMARVDRISILKPHIAQDLPVSLSTGQTVDLEASVLGSNDQALPQKEDGEKSNQEEPKKDDRTWLQKNWLFVALGFFILANRLGAVGQDAGQQQQGVGRQIPVGQRQ
eukprot:jgi/Picsp_1/6223/NSC_03577-R1_aspartate carbamoyltransferase